MAGPMPIPRVENPTSLAVVSFIGGQPAHQFYRGGVADRAGELSACHLPTPKWAQIGGLALCPNADAALWLDHLGSAGAGVKISRSQCANLY